MGAPPPAPGRRLLPAHQDLETVPGPGLRGQKNRILDLYAAPPKDGAVVCFDECGPLELRPVHGSCWAPRGHPQRLPATYRRLQGTEQLLAFYDVHANCLVGQVRKRKTHRDVLAVFRRLRACYPAETRLYIVMDNLNTHRHQRVREYLACHNMEAVPTPTYASWLNAIEAHFTPLKKFALTVSDDRDHRSRRRRIARYLGWRNREAGSAGHPLARVPTIKLHEH